jgi:hypothetical protein
MQISFEDLLGGHYSEPDFVKVDEVEALPPETVFEAVENRKKNTSSYSTENCRIKNGFTE